MENSQIYQDVCLRGRTYKLTYKLKQGFETKKQDLEALVPFF